MPTRSASAALDRPPRRPDGLKGTPGQFCSQERTWTALCSAGRQPPVTPASRGRAIQRLLLVTPPSAGCGLRPRRHDETTTRRNPVSHFDGSASVMAAPRFAPPRGQPLISSDSAATKQSCVVVVVSSCPARSACEHDGSVTANSRRIQLTSTTSSVRGPWTPRIRVISISAVAEGPEMVVSSAGLHSATPRSASGTVCTTRPARITHRW